MSAELGGYGFQSESMVLSSGTSDLGEGSIAISQMTLDGFNARLDDVTLNDDDGYDNESYQLTYTTPTWRNWSATLSAREVRAQTDYDLCYTASFTTSNNCRDDYQNDSQSLLLQHTGEGQSSQVRWSESNSERAYATDNTVGFSTQGKNRQISALHSRNLTNDLSLTVGIDLDEQGYDDGADQRTRDNNATFVNLRRQSERLTLSAGIRSDDNDDFGRHTSWRVTALSQTPLDNVVLKIAAGTGFRAPSPYEIGYNSGPWAYAPAADQALSEEQSAGWELGLRDTSGALVWEVTYFDQDITDAIIFDLVGYSGYVQIQGKSQSTGVEASASWQLSDRLAVSGFVSQLDADDASGAPLPYRPGLTSQLSARYTDDRSNWMLTARQTADRVDEFGGDLKDYAVVDASYAYDITNNVKLSVRAENLANQKYTDIVGYRSPRRALYLGLNLTL
jgi:vitamin B12 transporter